LNSDFINVQQTISQSVYVESTMASLVLGGTRVTATGTELNKLGGFTGTSPTLNSIGDKLDTAGGGMTGTFVQADVLTFEDGDDTPTVGKGNIFKTDNTKSMKITRFDEGKNGQEIIVIVNDTSTVFVHSTKVGGILLSGGIDTTAAGGPMTYKFIYDGKNWYEISRTSNFKQSK
jgi:hypothetical protein